MDKIKQKGSCSFIPLSAKHTAFHERHPNTQSSTAIPIFFFTPTLFPTLQKPVKNAISAQHSTSAQVPPLSVAVPKHCLAQHALPSCLTLKFTKPS